MRPIYDLKMQDTFRVYGISGVENEPFTVTGLMDSLAVCKTQSGSTLIMPLDRPMPFAVFMEKPAPAEEIQPAVPEKKSAAPEIKHAVTEAKPVQAEAPKPAVKPAESAEEETAAPVRHDGVIQYYDQRGHWGKLTHPVFKGGLFFHVSQVEDDALREYLCRLKPGQAWPTIRLSYVECLSPRRTGGIVGGYIRAEEEIPPVPEEPAQERGYLSSTGIDDRGSVTSTEGSKYFFTRSEVIDPYLAVYLDAYAPVGALDSIDIKVTFKVFERKAIDIAWTNREDFANIMEDIAAKIPDREKENWESCGNRYGEAMKKAEQELEIAAFVALPLK